MGSEFDFGSIKTRRLAGLVLLYLIAILLLFEVFISQTGARREEAIYEGIGGCVAYLIPVFWLWRKFGRKGTSIRQVFFANDPGNTFKWSNIILLTAALLSFSMGAFILSYIPLSHILPGYVKVILEDKSIYTPAESAIPAAANLLDFIMGAIMAPVVEEIVFRGVLLNRFMLKWSVKTSVIVSSLLFGILHFDLIGAFMFGAVMSMLYLKTKNLLVPVLCHALNNVAAYGITYILFFIEGKEELYTIEQLRSDFWWGVLALAVSLPFLAVFVFRNSKCLVKNKEKEVSYEENLY